MVQTPARYNVGDTDTSGTTPPEVLTPAVQTPYGQQTPVVQTPEVLTPAVPTGTPSVQQWINHEVMTHGSSMMDKTNQVF